MAINLTADPAALSNASSKIDSLQQQFDAAYTQLMTAVDGAHNAWRGGDSDTFYQRARDLDDDFKRISNLLRGAANDLKESSTKYAQTQDNARGRASGLATSI